MSENDFLTALQKITSTNASLTELIDAAGPLGASNPELARQLYKVWISFNPEHPQLYVALFNCSGLDSQLGDSAAAAAALKRAIEINADFMPAYINLGGVLERSGDIHGAIAQWQACVSRPTAVTGASVGYVVTALKQIARLASDHEGLPIAESAIRHCLEINPNQRDVIEQLIAARLSQCKWPVIDPWEGVDKKALISAIHPLSLAVYTDDPLLQLAGAERYVRQSAPGPAEPDPSDRRHAPIELSGRRLRVGYVSSDLRDHAIGYLMAELLELHDRSEVEVFAYYCGREDNGALNARIRAAVEHWGEIRGLSDEAAAAAIAADGIDVLVDVNGHTRDSRTGVFARRPAPIQVNWLGYPGSMGSPYHQYLIADDWIIPRGSELFYSEKVLRLPCYQPNDRKRKIAQPGPSRHDAGLPDAAMVFCCFNGTHKINRFTFDRWLQILNAVEGSVLWLLDAAAETKGRLGAYAEQRAVAASRLVFAPKQANAHHLSRYPLADLFLDTAPYGAHTTASDALWMGVPVLTLSGRSFASRVCGSLVRSAGLPELVCEAADDYVRRAIALGTDRAKIAALKGRLEAGRASCTLFDTALLARRLEGLYRDMCSEHQQGRLPRPDLGNLEAYFEVGGEFDHEATEMLTVPDYQGLYRSSLARRHMARPMRPDGRLWTEAGVEAIEQMQQEETAVEEPPRRKRAAAG
jgi:predicted O-linked N-acetylglucosamine transferase (SPINDLY family)